MSNLRVLIVEDDPEWLQKFKSASQTADAADFDFIYVSTVAEALQQIHEGVDLISLDLMLPDSQNPVATLKTVATAAHFTPIIVTSSVAGETFIQEAFNLKVYDYIEKSKWDIPTLIHVLRQAIRRFISQTCANLGEGLESIVSNFEAIDAKLSALQARPE